MIRRRAISVDALFKSVWKQTLGKDLDRPGIAVAATGGYGRRQLFPYSDIDLLYIFANEDAEREFREAVRSCNQTLWDIGLSVSPAMRTLKECERADPDNLEFIVATLDRRFLTGDSALYRRFQTEVLPALLLREWSTITQKLAEMARARHAKYSNTIFHLEPNIKECPGGLRDYQLAQWLLLLRHLQEQQSWPKESPRPRKPARTTPNRPSTFSPQPDVSCISAAIATTTPSTGTPRTKPPPSASASRPEAPPIPPTGCAPTTAMPAPSSAAPR